MAEKPAGRSLRVIAIVEGALILGLVAALVLRDAPESSEAPPAAAEAEPVEEPPTEPAATTPEVRRVETEPQIPPESTPPSAAGDGSSPARMLTCTAGSIRAGTGSVASRACRSVTYATCGQQPPGVRDSS